MRFTSTSGKERNQGKVDENEQRNVHGMVFYLRLSQPKERSHRGVGVHVFFLFFVVALLVLLFLRLLGCQSDTARTKLNRERCSICLDV